MNAPENPRIDNPTITLSTKGQVILPKAIRERRQWDTGDAPSSSSRTGRRA